MNEDQARTLLTTERADVERLLAENQSATQEAVDAEQETGDSGDPAQPLTAEGVDGAIAETLTNRLAAVDRALARLDAGTYGKSIRSGEPIPDERLEADPAAELTVTEAAATE
jgi:DnaK suppressor protein